MCKKLSTSGNIIHIHGSIFLHTQRTIFVDFALTLWNIYRIKWKGLSGNYGKAFAKIKGNFALLF